MFPRKTPFEEPIWSTPFSRHSTIEFSKAAYGSFDTRLALAQGDRIYGLAIPHDGRISALLLLATAPALPDLISSTAITVCIDKIYSEPKEFGEEAFTLAFNWPEEEDWEDWDPPTRQFAGHHTSVTRGRDLVDEVSGRVVIGSKYEDGDFPANKDGVEWSDITGWSVVDFAHPQFLPSSFKL
ncbi:hypothetical protein M413DRAFT_272960 [Hebeloma cylindrosporum]|uniref:Uncharacterized protein n=1 Tax=Hebeloma cylindrosporum TaxID=76867 RepID=A0A0C2Z283_HEBCY|nr:hypothetical protein M413DRAFT_272960 [Hebeloma cylindrosporum h7]